MSTDVNVVRKSETINKSCDARQGHMTVQMGCEANKPLQATADSAPRLSAKAFGAT
jgi:hypothetical protein